ncbi:MAG: PH domain-containing protein [Chloracidobacterium sp.]|nr:PH domain-containing protein [Chloracidobacterium sp.]
MFCIKCGAENPEDAAFCKKCGAPTVDEVETRVAPRQSGLPEEKGKGRIFSITPTLKFVKVGYGATVVGSFLLVAFLSVILPSVSWFIVVGLGLLLLLVPAFYHIKQKLVRYTLTETTIEIDRGLISRTTQNIPLRRIQDVTVSSTFFQRLLGFGDIVIENASENAGRVVLDNIDRPRKYADLLLDQIRHLDD